MPGYPERVDHLVIHIAGSSLGHCPHCILGIARRTDFACDKDIEREMEAEAELISNGHATAGKCQNETLGVVTIMHQLSDKPTACLFTVFEHHRYFFLVRSVLRR